MPPLHAPYLYDWLMTAGPVQAGGMGPSSLSATELTAWAAASGQRLQPWEFQALQRASRAYCSEQLSPGDWPPYGDPDDLYDDDTVADRLAAGLDKLCS